MKSPAGSQRKGAAWERSLCKALSLWLTNNERPDLFSRNVLSGGRFTIAAEKGDKFGGLPGDIISAHPLAYAFVSVLAVEAKHGAKPDLHKYILDTKGTSFLAVTLAKAQRQAKEAGLEALVIPKLNRTAPYVLMGRGVGECALTAAEGKLVRYHRLHSNTVMLVLLDDFVSQVNPAMFCASVSEMLKTPR